MLILLNFPKKLIFPQEEYSPMTQRLRHQDSERVDTLCDNHSNGGCPCAVREVGQYRDKEKYQPTF